MDPLQELGGIGAVASGLPIGLCAWSARSGALVYANPVYRAMVGAPPEGDWSPSHQVQMRDGGPWPDVRIAFTRVVRDRKPITVDDLVLQRSDGSKVSVRAAGRPLLDAGGAVAHVIVTLTDVTEAVEAQERADLIQRRLLHVLDNAPLILFAFDRRGMVNLSEGRGLLSIGFRPKELVGRSIYALYANDPVSLANADRVLAGEQFSVESTVGSVVLETLFTPVRNAAGEVEGAIGVSIDVTERVRMQTRLLQVARLGSMGTLSATVAHEINNPLSYILGNLDLASAALSEGAPTPAVQRLAQWVDQAREGADRVRRIVRGLRAFSRKDDERTKPTDVQVVLEHALGMADNAIRHRARLVRRFDPLPLIFANDLRLGQVFVNLLLNAAQAIPEGHADENEIRVSTSFDKARNAVVVAVEDTGSGIAPEVKARIFEPFFTTKRVGVGTGLGLSICYGIVTGLGGTIEVESTPGKGATFRVRLPASDRARGEDTQAPLPPPTTRRGRILIVDDDAKVARTFELLLKAEHNVSVSLEPRSVVERITRGERFDLIFCDLMMPDMTGMEVHAAISESNPEQAQRIVFVTGGAFTPAARAFVQNVPNTFLEKPFDREALAAVLAKFIGE